MAFTIVAVTVKPTLILLLEGFSGLDGTDAVRLSIRIGLILTLVTTILQLLCLVLAWLFASGRLVMSGRSGPAARLVRIDAWAAPLSFERLTRPATVRATAVRATAVLRAAPSAPPSFGGAPSWSQSFAPPGACSATLSGDLTTPRKAPEPVESLRRPAAQSLQRITQKAFSADSPCR